MGVSAVFSPLRAYIHSFIWSYIICGKTSNATSGRVLQSCGFWASSVSAHTDWVVLDCHQRQLMKLERLSSSGVKKILHCSWHVCC